MQKLAIINGLRGVAILAVMVRHVFISTSEASFGLVHARGLTFFPLAPIFNSQEAVTLFFILSGFVLALPYAAGRRTMSGFRDALSFYARRAKRLLPLLVIVLIGSVLLAYPLKGLEMFMDKLWINARLMVIFGIDPARPPVNTPLWSLRVELWFCLLMPAVLIVLQRMGLYLLLIASVSFSLGIHVLAFTLEPAYRSPVISSIAVTLSDFVIGMCLARWFADGMPGMRSRLLLPVSLGMVAAGTMLSQHSIYYGSPAHIPFAHLATMIGISLTVAALLQSGTSLLKKTLELWPLQMIGLMSYSLYAWHAPLLWPLHARRSMEDAALYLIFMLGFAFLSYRFLEFPHVRDIKKLLPQQKKHETQLKTPPAPLLQPEVVPA